MFALWYIIHKKKQYLENSCLIVSQQLFLCIIIFLIFNYDWKLIAILFIIIPPFQIWKFTCLVFPSIYFDLSCDYNNHLHEIYLDSFISFENPSPISIINASAFFVAQKWFYCLSVFPNGSKTNNYFNASFANDATRMFSILPI